MPTQVFFSHDQAPASNPIVHRSISGFIAAVLVAALAILICNALLSIWSIRRVTEDDACVARTQEARVNIKELIPIVRNMVGGLRGHAMTGNDQFLQQYDEYLTSLRSEIA